MDDYGDPLEKLRNIKWEGFKVPIHVKWTEYECMLCLKTVDPVRRASGRIEVYCKDCKIGFYITERIE